jgi:hypothetical protein
MSTFIDAYTEDMFPDDLFGNIQTNLLNKTLKALSGIAITYTIKTIV